MTETLPMKKMKKRPALSLFPRLAFISVDMGMLRMTMSVATFVNVEMVTLSIECTAEHSPWPGGGDQFALTGEHQNAMRNMCVKKVASVKTQALNNPIRVARPWRLKME